MEPNRENTGKEYKVGKNKPPLETRWAKGQSGNPEGRPEGAKSRATIYKKWLDIATTVKDLEGKELPGTVEDRVTISMIKKAIDDGDVTAAKEIFDSVYGKVTDKVQHSTDPEHPVIFQIDGRFKDAT